MREKWAANNRQSAPTQQEKRIALLALLAVRKGQREIAGDLRVAGLDSGET